MKNLKHLQVHRSGPVLPSHIKDEHIHFLRVCEMPLRASTNVNGCSFLGHFVQTIAVKTLFYPIFYDILL